MRTWLRLLKIASLGVVLSSSMAIGATRSTCEGKAFYFDKEAGYVEFDGVKYTKTNIPEANTFRFGEGSGLISQLFLGDRVSPGDLDKDGEIAFLRMTTLYLDKGLKGDRVDAELVTTGLISQRRKIGSITYLCKQN